MSGTGGLRHTEELDRTHDPYSVPRIQHQKIVFRGRAHQEGFFAIVTNVNCKSGTFTQSRGDILCQSDFVFHHKNAQ